MFPYVALVIGIILGFLLSLTLLRVKRVGSLRFFESDPYEPPIMTADLDELPESIRKRKYVVFNVSQK